MWDLLIRDHHRVFHLRGKRPQRGAQNDADLRLKIQLFPNISGAFFKVSIGVFHGYASSFHSVSILSHRPHGVNFTLFHNFRRKSHQKGLAFFYFHDTITLTNLNGGTQNGLSDRFRLRQLRRLRRCLPRGRYLPGRFSVCDRRQCLPGLRFLQRHLPQWRHQPR